MGTDILRWVKLMIRYGDKYFKMGKTNDTYYNNA